MRAPARVTAAVRQWLRTFEGHVRAADFEAARPMFASDVVAFGTRAEVATGRRRLERDQWRRVWPAIRGFRFRLGELRCLGGPDAVCAIVPWGSRGVRADGTTFSRPGRATLFLVRTAGRWVAVHSHFSLAPAPRTGGASPRRGRRAAF
jgi:ketosteroid isomerase-like protein